MIYRSTEELQQRLGLLDPSTTRQRGDNRPRGNQEVPYLRIKLTDLYDSLRVAYSSHKSRIIEKDVFGYHAKDTGRKLCILWHWTATSPYSEGSPEYFSYLCQDPRRCQNILTDQWARCEPYVSNAAITVLSNYKDEFKTLKTSGIDWEQERSIIQCVWGAFLDENADMIRQLQVSQFDFDALTLAVMTSVQHFLLHGQLHDEHQVFCDNVQKWARDQEFDPEHVPEVTFTASVDTQSLRKRAGVQPISDKRYTFLLGSADNGGLYIEIATFLDHCLHEGKVSGDGTKFDDDTGYFKHFTESIVRTDDGLLPVIIEDSRLGALYIEKPKSTNKLYLELNGQLFKQQIHDKVRVILKGRTITPQFVQRMFNNTVFTNGKPEMQNTTKKVLTFLNNGERSDVERS